MQWCRLHDKGAQQLIAFERIQDSPVVSPTPGGFDCDATFSPAVIEHDGVLHMLYAGHCALREDSIPAGREPRILGATSGDGVSWIKHAEPVLRADPSVEWMRLGVAEPGIVQGPDGIFYLFFTAMQLTPSYTKKIGLAWGPSPFGPWTIAPTPIVEADEDAWDRECLAPSVRIEGDVVRMWYLGAREYEVKAAVGYAEANWPLVRDGAAGEWSKHPDPVWSGTTVASDPSVVHTGDAYRMFYTDVCPALPANFEEPFWTQCHHVICQTVSDDGLTWRDVPLSVDFPGLTLDGRPGSWEESIEACCAVQLGSQTLLFYSAYANGGPEHGNLGCIGVARRVTA